MAPLNIHHVGLLDKGSGKATSPVCRVKRMVYHETAQAGLLTGPAIYTRPGKNVPSVAGLYPAPGLNPLTA